jgi:hypothetical protein
MSTMSEYNNEPRPDCRSTFLRAAPPVLARVSYGQFG